MKLTKRKALQECIRIWSVLAATGDGDKRSVKNADKYESACPCCHYSKVNDDLYCDEDCIIKWPGSWCLSAGSPFAKWEDAVTRATCKKYAQQIVKLAEEALAKLDEGGQE